MSPFEAMAIRALSQRFVKCVECDRKFDLAVPVDADEWYYGHDCEGH